MNDGAKTIVIPVRDVAAAREVYSAALGVAPYVDAPYYVGFQAGGQEIGLDPNGHARGFSGPVPYWHVADIAGTVAALQAAGATPHEPIHDVGGGRQIATLRDGDGNLIGLLQLP